MNKSLSALAACLLSVVVAASAGPAKTDATPEELAAAALVDPSLLAAASFQQDASPGALPGAQSTATDDDPFLGMPSHGPTYTVLSNGNAACVDGPGACGGFASTSFGGGTYRGAFDVTVLRVDLDVPADDNHLGIEVRLLSEEFPAFVGSCFTDAFFAELDTHDWTAGGCGVPSAPHDFARDQHGHRLTSGTAAMQALGATAVYNGGTCLLRNWVAAAPGPHTLYFSILETGDGIFDSAALLDAIRTNHYAATPGPACKAPLALAVSAGPATTCTTTHFEATGPAPLGNATYEWDFGDGSGAVTAVPAVDHDYSAAGSQFVTVRRMAGGAVDKGELDLPVAPCTLTLAADQEPTSACRDTAFTAAIEPFAAAVSFAWDFGDGATATTPEPSVAHAYALPGTFEASVAATMPNGSVLADAVAVTVLPCAEAGESAHQGLGGGGFVHAEAEAVADPSTGETSAAAQCHVKVGGIHATPAECGASLP